MDLVTADGHPVKGLTAAEVARLTAAGQANDWEPAASDSIVWIVVKNLFIVFNVMIFPLLAILLALGQYKDVISVGGIALLNTAINIFQEIRAKLALDRIRVEHPALACVIRDGVAQSVPVKTVVRGDALVLAAGELVLADGPVIAAAHLELDESMLTGESDYVEKMPGDPVLSGSFAVAGEGIYLAEKIGAEAYMQRVVAATRVKSDRRTQLERRVDVLVRTFMVLCFAVAGLLVLLYNPFASGLVDPVRFIVAAVTSLIPQGLVLIVTVAFALGVIAFARRGIIFRRMNAVEALSGIDLVCMDKTGTLTHNRIVLEAIVPADGIAEAAVRDALALFAHGVSSKNKTVEAIAAALPDPGCGNVVDELPFKSANKFSAIRSASASATLAGVSGIGAAARHDLVVGAAEMLASRFVGGAVPAALLSAIDACERKGMRSIVLAGRAAGSEPLDEESLAGLVPLGFVVFREEIKDEAPEILAGFAARGIRQVVISGDSLVTVQSIARQIGLEGADSGASGPELATLDAEAFRARVLASTVFARVLPEQKKAIIRTFRDAGFHVAMVGDGVNDVLALKEAELAIAMGSGGSMARNVADIVLVNNRFDLLPGLLEEGERIVSRIQDCARIFTLKNSYALVLILATLAIGLNFPFFPQQITMINFVTITIPLLYLVKFSKLRNRVDRHFIRGIIAFSAFFGLLVAGASLVLNALASETAAPFAVQTALGMTTFIGHVFANPSHYAQTLAIVPIVFMAALAFLALLSRARRLVDLARDRIIFSVSLALVGLFACALYCPPVARFFEFVPLASADLVLAAKVTLPALVVEWFALRFFMKRFA